MENNVQLIEAIIQSLSSEDPSTLIQKIQPGEGNWQNELLLFVKPEIFMVDQKALIRESLQLVFDKLSAFDVHVDGIITLTGSLLDEMGIMNRHYGFINRLSRSASQILTGEDHKMIAAALNLPSLDGYELMGGHEYLSKFPKDSLTDLDTLWFSKSIVKIRSGFYLQIFEKDGSKIILVNGFHPSQLAHFTDPTHRIVLFLVHSNSSWRALKNDMVGATFPEKAVAGSIRATLNADPSQYGLKSVTIANNGVHLSAGPYEAAFEIVNFFGKILPEGFLEQYPPLVMRKLASRGILKDAGADVLANPQVQVEAKTIDLFSASEDLDTEAAIDLWQHHQA